MKSTWCRLGGPRILGNALLAWVALGLSFTLAGQAAKTSPSQDLISAVKAGDDARVKTLLKSGADTNFKDADGLTPLLYAAYRGGASTIVILLDAGADVNGRDSLGMTPLHAAAFEGRLEVIRVLLARGATTSVQDKWGHGPLFYALQNHHADAATLLQQGLPAKVPEPPPKATRKYTDETLTSGGAPIIPVDPCCPQTQGDRGASTNTSSQTTLSQVQAEQRIDVCRDRIRQLTLDRDALADRLADLYRQCEESMRSGTISTPTVVDPNDPKNNINSSGYAGRGSSAACNAYSAAQSQASRIQEDINRYQSEIYNLQYLVRR
jgi:ankyrin repeat protein